MEMKLGSPASKRKAFAKTCLCEEFSKSVVVKFILRSAVNV